MADSARKHRLKTRLRLILLLMGFVVAVATYAEPYHYSLIIIS